MILLKVAHDKIDANLPNLPSFSNIFYWKTLLILICETSCYSDFPCIFHNGNPYGPAHRRISTAATWCTHVQSTWHCKFSACAPACASFLIQINITTALGYNLFHNPQGVQTTGLLKSFKMGFRTMLTTNFWLRFDNLYGDIYLYTDNTAGAARSNIYTIDSTAVFIYLLGTRSLGSR